VKRREAIVSEHKTSGWGVKVETTLMLYVTHSPYARVARNKRRCTTRIVIQAEISLSGFVLSRI
jgi:hypothetical protein